jgi:hypothetical protein
MESTGLDMLLDVHGDEEIPANVSKPHLQPRTADRAGHSQLAVGLFEAVGWLSHADCIG